MKEGFDFKKRRRFILVFSLLIPLVPVFVYYHLHIVYWQKGDVEVKEPEIFQVFYDELQGEARSYYIESPEKDFILNFEVLVPLPQNPEGRYSAKIHKIISQTEEEEIAFLDASLFEWELFYDSFTRNYYLKGPHYNQKLGAGFYRLEIYSDDSQGKYVLKMGHQKRFDIPILKNFWQLPLLKIQFFKTSPLEFFVTPLGIVALAFIGAFFIFLTIIYYLIGTIKDYFKKKKQRTLFLASDWRTMKNEIRDVLQKPSYNVLVAFIWTAAKPFEDMSYVKRDVTIMKDDFGFNVEEIDIDDKDESQLKRILSYHDIIFIEDGDIFYLLEAMKRCNFKKVIKKLLEKGKVYMGTGVGSVVAGKYIETVRWKGEGKVSFLRIRKQKGLGLVPFSLFVHFQPGDEEVIKKRMPWRWQRRKLKIITDKQALFIQGKEIAMMGGGEIVAF